jgi:hypothetical protein
MQVKKEHQTKNITLESPDTITFSSSANLAIGLKLTKEGYSAGIGTFGPSDSINQYLIFFSFFFFRF